MNTDLTAKNAENTKGDGFLTGLTGCSSGLEAGKEGATAKYAKYANWSETTINQSYSPARAV
jgi:hypothetical protein